MRVPLWKLIVVASKIYRFLLISVSCFGSLLGTQLRKCWRLLGSNIGKSLYFVYFDFRVCQW